METLIARLQGGPHPVRAARDESTVALVDSVRRGFVLLRFEHTRGGTELGIQLDPTTCDPVPSALTSADKHMRLVGDLSLDGQAVRCVVELDLKTLRGLGQIELHAS